jgi:hypothetical protein
MKRVIDIDPPFMFVVGFLIGMMVIGFTKPTEQVIKKEIVYKYIKLPQIPDWKSEKNPKKLEYLEHLYNTSK